MTDIDFTFFDDYDGLPDDIRDDIRSNVNKQVAHLNGTTLRKESEKNATAAEKYRNALLEKQFAEHKIPGKPAAYRGLENLDPTDPASVPTWGTEMGLIAPPAPDPAVTENLDAQQRIADTVAGGIAPNPQLNVMEDLNSTKNEADTLALLQRSGMTVNSAT
ncbi:MAG: hypothetical protein H0U59_08455 [Gemmatimonadaceae bacterium]|nr:hypothetical protein [Gemmatimonadaceae bacterium]